MQFYVSLACNAAFLQYVLPRTRFVFCIHVKPAVVTTRLLLYHNAVSFFFLTTMLQDEDSQAILSLLQCTNSRLSFSGSVGGGGGDASVDATSSTTSADRTAAASGKRRGRVECSGELDAREVANGFGMGMSSKVLHI